MSQSNAYQEWNKALRSVTLSKLIGSYECKAKLVRREKRARARERGKVSGTGAKGGEGKGVQKQKCGVGKQHGNED
jgi:hypothetical protein